jgi:hypothetical protein
VPVRKILEVLAAHRLTALGMTLSACQCLRQNSEDRTRRSHRPTCSVMIRTMKAFSELTGRGRLTEGLRWLCVLPAAVLGGIAAQFVVEAVVQIASYGGWRILGDSNVANSLMLFLYYVLPKSAFAIAGPKMAPRHRKATATVLTLLGLLFSLMTHVIVQNLAGKPVGIANYTHLFAESAGLLGGASYILLQDRRNRRTETTA